MHSTPIGVQEFIEKNFVLSRKSLQETYLLNEWWWVVSSASAIRATIRRAQKAVWFPNKNHFPTNPNGQITSFTRWKKELSKN